MSHELETINGNVAMAYAGEVPWHGLGVRVPADLTPQQMLEAANLDWKVVPRQLYYEQTIDGKTKRFKVGNKALVRDVDGKVLTVISKDWNPVQNDEAFEFFHDLVMAGNMSMHTAGSLLGGKKVWALAKIDEEFELRVNGKATQDRVEAYLLLTNPHEYGRAIDARFTAVRVVCNNTHTMAVNKRGGVSANLNHRTKFDPEKLKEMLGIAHLGMSSYRSAAEFLATKRYDEEKVREFMAKLFPHGNKEEREAGNLSRVAEQAVSILETQPGADFAPGTWWNAFNAVTFSTDHLVGRSADSRMTSSWYGLNRARKTQALELAKEYATAA